MIRKKWVASLIFKESANTVVVHCSMYNLNLSIWTSARVNLLTMRLNCMKTLPAPSIVFKKINLMELNSGH